MLTNVEPCCIEKSDYTMEISVVGDLVVHNLPAAALQVVQIADQHRQHKDRLSGKCSQPYAVANRFCGRCLVDCMR